MPWLLSLARTDSCLHLGLTGLSHVTCHTHMLLSAYFYNFHRKEMYLIVMCIQCMCSNFKIPNRKKRIICASILPLQILLVTCGIRCNYYTNNNAFSNVAWQETFCPKDVIMLSIATQILFWLPLVPFRPPYMVDYYTASRVLFPTSLLTQAWLK